MKVLDKLSNLLFGKKESLIIQPSQNDTKELEKIKQGVSEQAGKDLESFYTLVKTLNEGLEDNRLDSAQGTVKAMSELKDYYALFGKKMQIFLNGEKDEKGNPQVYFEV